jgi:hypothetical protein
MLIKQDNAAFEAKVSRLKALSSKMVEEKAEVEQKKDELSSSLKVETLHCINALI